MAHPMNTDYFDPHAVEDWLTGWTPTKRPPMKPYTKRGQAPHGNMFPAKHRKTIGKHRYKHT